MSATSFLPTPRQIDYAMVIARNLKEQIPADLAQDRAALSQWISERKARLSAAAKRTAPTGATSKQVGYAERIAMRKRIDVPRECFQDAKLMSRWIDRNR